MKLSKILIVGLVLNAGLIAQAQSGVHKAVVNQGATPVTSNENWKGAPYNHLFDIHGGVGLGIFEGSAGLAFLFGAATEVAHEGFIGDGINDQVYLEASTGPVILANAVDPWVYSLHLRWDFHMNLDWTCFAIGGVGGSFGTGLGRFFPRFGAGLMMHLNDNLALRTEISHEWMSAGVSFGF